MANVDSSYVETWEQEGIVVYARTQSNAASKFS